jgi:hypothetical protein
MVKCILTNEFHYYDDECNCEEARVKLSQDTFDIEKALHEPIKAYSNDLAARQFICDSKAVHEGTMLVSDPFCDVSFSTDAVVGATDCLICSEAVSLHIFEHGPRICEGCKKAIKFIRERFREELETHEM